MMSGTILCHKDTNYYQVLSKTKIRTEDGWVDGYVYFKLQKEQNCFVVDHNFKFTFARPTSLFGENWKIIREGYNLSF